MDDSIQYEAFLKLETGSHTARIRQLLVTPDGKSLITAGEDKTIRLWDIKDKRQTSMLLGQVGEGEDGKIQAIAISPDGKYLAAIVWLSAGSHDHSERDSDIRVFELATGNLQSRFRYPGTLQDLDFSSDGAYLTMVGNPKGPVRCGYVYLYESNKIMQGFGKLPAPFKKHVNVLYDNDTLIPSYVRFIPQEKGKPADYRLVAATWIHNKGIPGEAEYTGKLYWYECSAKSMKEVAQCETAEFTWHDTQEVSRIRPSSLVVSREFAITTAENRDVKEFFCYNHRGQLVARVPSETVPAQPSFSNDGSQLIVGQRDDNILVQIKVYNTLLGQFQLKSTYYGHDADTVAVALLQDGMAVSAGGDQNAIHFWSPDHMEGEQFAVIRGTGRVVHAVGVNEEEQIGVGNRDDLRLEDKIILQRVFDLRTMTLKPLALRDSATFQRAQTTLGDQRLEWKEQWGWVNLFLNDQQPLSVYPAGWYHATTYGFTPKGTIVTGDSEGKVRVAVRRPDESYDTPQRYLVGHTAKIRDHAASSKWLVTGSRDQVIRLWHLEDVDQDVTTDLEPALNLFIGTDDEWVIWSKSGYYNASQRGDRRFGYHINRGADKEAIFFASDRFIKTFFRPDIIQAIVELGSEEKALAKLSGNAITSPLVDVSQILPPIIELAKNGITTTEADVKFTFTVESLGKPVSRVWIVQNDQFVWESLKPKSRYAVTLPLQSGQNRFKILAENENAKSPPLTLTLKGSETSKGKPLTGEVTARGAKAAEAARAQSNVFLGDQATKVPQNGILYLLAVGVSKLQNETEDFKSLRYAHVDASSIFNAFAKSKLSGPLDKKAPLKNKAFLSVEATILQNEEATKAAILEAIDNIAEKIRVRAQQGKAQRDVFFVFLSGHGVRRSDSYERELYFWNYDLDKSSTRATGLSFIEIGEKITSLPADIIIATDACHSGMAGSDVVRGLDPNELAKQMYAINERGMYVLNAARSEQFALEAKVLEHGVFTKSILETLENEGKEINMLNLIASVQTRVNYYTSGRQMSVCRTYGDLLPLKVYEK
ncbi:MAG: caspase family protein [Chloroflexota bacterium]|nr:caspase family protein [Anaerolineales bacterium]